MRILITGALGHIGSKLIRDIPANKGAEIILIDNISTQRFFSIFNLPSKYKYTFIADDVRNILSHEKKIGTIDCIIHLAAITDAASSFNIKDKVLKNNFESTKTVADYCSSKGIPLIFPSSTSIYGPSTDAVDESSDELFPQSPYAESKLKEEKYIIELGLVGLKYSILRLGTIYGVSNGMRFHTAVNKFCWQASIGEPITVWSTAYNQVRPYLDIKDAINLFAYIIKNKIYDNSIYNAVSGNYTVEDVINSIKQIVKVNIEFVDSEIMNQLSYKVLSDKLQNRGFKFEGSLEKGITETLTILGCNNKRRA